MNNREELTRQAEKCLRQGRLDEAITLYQLLAEVTPVDWNIVKQLADLLERAGQREAACVQFARWADYLFAEGFHPKAAALFKKVLKLEPNHEHALWQLAEVSIALKLRADARVAFGRVADLRQRRNDAAGADHARRRLAELDGPGSPPMAASPLAGLSLAQPTLTPATPPTASGSTDAQNIPSLSVPPQVAAPVAAAVAAAPASSVVPAPVSAAPAAVAVAPPDPVTESPAAQLARLRDEAMRAEVMLAPDAAARWLAVLDADPDDLGTRLRLIRRALERRDVAEAVRLSSVLDPADDASFMVLVELAVASGRAGQVADLAGVRVAIGGGVDRTLAPATTLARRLPDAARAVIVEAAAAWTSKRQSHLAVAAFVYGQQLGVLDAPACERWVDTCADDAAQLQVARPALAEAYLATGRAADARAVAETLCRATGDEPRARHLLLRAVTAEGHADPAAIVARILAPAVPEPEPDLALDLDLDLVLSNVAAASIDESASAHVAPAAALTAIALEPEPWTVLSLDDDLDTIPAETFEALPTPEITTSVDDGPLHDVELAEVVPAIPAPSIFESPRGVGHYALDDEPMLDEPMPASPVPADEQPMATLEDWLGPVVAAAPPTPAPAVIARSDFDWADLLGRDLGYGGDDGSAPDDAPREAEAEAAA
ncbi:MAG TPA: hypothetical protein VMF13_20035, partial [Luteitalea sp.]|nr:hypothetical protein [Luteitalea sp.]